MCMVRTNDDGCWTASCHASRCKRNKQLFRYSLVGYLGPSWLGLGSWKNDIPTIRRQWRRSHGNRVFRDVFVSKYTYEPANTKCRRYYSLTATKTLPYYASLQEVSALFKLTNDQHRAFVIIGRALLRSFESNHSNEKVAATNQELLLLRGLAGSGKSFVIRAWKALADSWEHGSTPRLYEHHAHRPGKCHKE